MSIIPLTKTPSKLFPVHSFKNSHHLKNKFYQTVLFKDDFKFKYLDVFNIYTSEGNTKGFVLHNGVKTVVKLVQIYSFKKRKTICGLVNQAILVKSYWVA